MRKYDFISDHGGAPMGYVYRTRYTKVGSPPRKGDFKGHPWLHGKENVDAWLSKPVHGKRRRYM